MDWYDATAFAPPPQWSIGMWTCSRSAPFEGNGLIVAFAETRTRRAEALVSVTAELRQFELIVVDAPPRGVRVSARIFTAQEELPFAGHPVFQAPKTSMRHASRGHSDRVAPTFNGSRCRSFRPACRTWSFPSRAVSWTLTD